MQHPPAPDSPSRAPAQPGEPQPRPPAVVHAPPRPHGDGDGPPLQRASLRRIALTLGLGMVLAAAAVAVVTHFASAGRVLHRLERADPKWFVLCVLGEVGAYIGYILAYHDFARADDGPELSYSMVTEIIAMGFGAFVITSAGGPAVDYWALHRAGVSRAEALARTIGLNALKFGMFSILATIAAVLALLGIGGHVPRSVIVLWIAITGLCGGLAFGLTSGRLGDRLTRRPERPADPGTGMGRLWRTTAFLARELLASALVGVRLVRHMLARPTRYPAGLLGFGVYWAGDLLCLYAALRAFGGDVGLIPLVLGYATGYFGTSIPLPAGGTGGVELGMTFALHLVGVPLAPALLGVAAYRFFNFWLPILPALAVLPLIRRLQRQLAGVAQERRRRGRLADEPA